MKTTATYNFVYLRELLAKKLKREKTERKRKEKYHWSHDRIKKGTKFSHSVAVFLGEAEWKLTKLVRSAVSSKF